MVTDVSDGVPFLSALYSKYRDEGSLEVIEFPQNDGHKRVCQYVGLDKYLNKLQNVTNLRFINLSNMKISFSIEGIDGDGFKLNGAHSLDLSLNLLQDWQTVGQIVSLTRCLRELMLTANPLKIPTDKEIEKIGNIFKDLKVVVLGNVGYSWDDVNQCAKLWPNVEELSLFENKITHISLMEDRLHNLTSLSLSTNPISDWNEICKLGKLTKLEKLELPHCKIAEIFFNDSTSEEKTALFPALKYLDLTNNQIADWKSVAQFNKLLQLEMLLLKKNPIYDFHQYYYNFNFVISRISGLTRLDREPISKEMRNDSEKYYLRLIYPEYLEKSKDKQLKQQFFDENPCFSAILNKFGEPVVSKTLSKEEKIKQNFLKLNICDEDNPDASKQKICKQVPISTKVSNLKFILRRLLKIDMREDFFLEITSKNYKEQMDDRNDVNMYRIDEDHLIYVRRMA